MFRQVVLLFTLFLSVLCLSCPSNYEPDGFGNCVITRYWYKDRNFAYNDCATDRAFLPIIQNAYVNSLLQSKSGNLTKIWLALTCTQTKEPKSCMWDNGQIIVSNSYTNFDLGEPRVDYGSCVTMNVNTGRWSAAPCQSFAAYGCQYNDLAYASQCAQPTDAYYRGKCYFTIPTGSFNYGQTACQQSCGNVVSIHNLGDSNFVRDLGSNHSYGFIGLQKTSSSYYWTDGSSFDYTHFGYENRNTGECVSIAFKDEEIRGGYWINSQCSGNGLLVVCEKDVSNACDNPGPVSTLSPPECPSTTFYNGSGVLYSPGYPLGSTSMQCEYVIIEEETSQAFITFDNLSLNSSLSFFYLYSTFFDSQPFAIVSYYTYERTFVSPTNILKIVYTADSYGQSHWSGTYGAYQNTTTTTTITAPIIPSISCSFLLDWSYLGNTSSLMAYDNYTLQHNLVESIAMIIYSSNYTIDTNFAAFGYPTKYSSNIFQPYYFPDMTSFVYSFENFYPDVRSQPITLCRMIDNINNYNIPNGTINSCLVFFSGESFREFNYCDQLVQDKFNVIIGAGLNGQSGVSIVSNGGIVQISDNMDYNDAMNVANVILTHVQ